MLWEHEKIALGKLAELTLIPPPSLVGIVDRLLAANLIKRDRSDYARRVVFILATQKGKDLESKVMPRVNDIYNEIRESFTHDQWSQLVGSLEKISLISKKQ